MGRVVCKAKKTGQVEKRGKPSVEWHKNGEPQYYCYGYCNAMTDELLDVCRECRDNVIYAQEDLDEWREKGGGE